MQLEWLNFGIADESRAVRKSKIFSFRVADKAIPGTDGRAVVRAMVLLRHH